MIKESTAWTKPTSDDRIAAVDGWYRQLIVLDGESFYNDADHDALIPPEFDFDTAWVDVYVLAYRRVRLEDGTAIYRTSRGVNGRYSNRVAFNQPTEAKSRLVQGYTDAQGGIHLTHKDAIMADLQAVLPNNRSAADLICGSSYTSAEVTALIQELNHVQD